MTELKTIIGSIVAGVVAGWATKDSIVALLVILGCLAIASAIAAIRRIPSSASASSSTGVPVSVFTFLALTAVLLALTSVGATAYAVKPGKPEASHDQPPLKSLNLTMNPKVELVSTGKVVNEYRATGTVSGLGPGDTIWVANLAKKEAKTQNIDEEDLAKAKVYPAFGPCIINGQNWRCDKVFMTHKGEDHYVMAYRVPSTDARDLVAYQKDAYSGQPNCQKGDGNFPPIIMPRDTQLKAHVEIFA